MSKAKKADEKRPGRPPKPPGEKRRVAVFCTTTFPPEVAAWLETLDPAGASRNTGMNALVWAVYRLATQEKSEQNPPAG